MIWNFNGLFTVPNNGRGGGLAMMWKSEVVVWVDSFSNYHIDTIVNGGREDAWRLTGFYGEPKTSRRSEGWNMLRMLSSKPKLPWCCFGDFNELLRVEDKKGGEKQRWRHKPFRFKAIWMTNSGCHITVVCAWESNQDGLPMYRTTKKLKKCKKMLKKWSTYHFGNVTRQIKKVKELFWKAEEESVRTGDIQEVWKGVWKIQASNKVRHFIWRAVKDSLPTKENLKKEQIQLDVTCSLCDDSEEDTMHALWLCDQARLVWKFEASFVYLYQRKFKTFMDLFEAVLDRGSVFKVAWFSTITWSLWQRRNRIRERQQTWPLHE
ncbi:hypothetical protein CFP56_035709, partial [Quercus suber]